MSKSIYDRVLNDLDILVKQANARKLSNDIVVDRWGLERIRSVINQAQKQEKLLELYKNLISIYDIDEHFNEPTNIELKKLYKRKIKELENE